MCPINYSCTLVSIILLMQVNFHYVYLPLSVSTIMKRREVDSCKSNWCGEGGVKVNSALNLEPTFESILKVTITYQLTKYR